MFENRGKGRATDKGKAPDENNPPKPKGKAPEQYAALQTKAEYKLPLRRHLTQASSSRAESPRTVDLAFDPQSETLESLSAMLIERKITSERIVQTYYAQIQSYNHILRAVIQCRDPEDLLNEAKQLDSELARRQRRSHLHGLPILIKDNIDVKGMSTTCGNKALQKATAKFDAEVVKILKRNGMIILGKTNMTEMSGMMMGNGRIPLGYSTVGGQTHSACVPFTNEIANSTSPGGSSSGSAVAVSAGFAPVALGTETEGSIVGPADRAGLYALRPVPGLIPYEGVVPIYPKLDTLGPMAKTPKDLALVMDVLAPKHPSWTSYLSKDMRGLCIAVPSLSIRSAAHLEPDELEMLEKIERVYSHLHKVTQSTRVAFMSSENIRFEYWTRTWIACLAFYSAFEKHMKKRYSWHCPEKEQVRNVADLIRQNLQNMGVAGPDNLNQSLGAAEGMGYDVIEIEAAADGLRSELRGVVNSGRMGSPGYIFNMNTGRNASPNVIIGDMYDPLVKFSAWGVYPAIALPISHCEGSGRPFGLVAIAQPGLEGLLLQLASAWDQMLKEAKIHVRRPQPDLEQRAREYAQPINAVAHAQVPATP